MNTIKLFAFAQLALAQLAYAQAPSEIIDKYVVAHKTLKFFEVAPYVYSRALAEYRKTTSAIIKHAAQKYGHTAVVDFFQGAAIDQLNAMSDQEYWAFVMASAQQFSVEKPMSIARPLSQFSDGAKLCLVYPATASLVTAPECGSYPLHVVYEFQQDQGVWKFAMLDAPQFERTSYWFLEQNYPERPVTGQK